MAGIWEIWSSGPDANAANQVLSEQMRRTTPGALVADVPERGSEIPMAHESDGGRKPLNPGHQLVKSLILTADKP